MFTKGLVKVVDSGSFVWPWSIQFGLVIIMGAAGGGGGGSVYDNGPVKGLDGLGCHYGEGGNGGAGAMAKSGIVPTTANGVNGGKGFPGETQVVDIAGLSAGDVFEIVIGIGGSGGKGFKPGEDGSGGVNGSVLFVPIFEGKVGN